MKKSLLIISLLIFMIYCFIPTIVKADSFKISFQADKDILSENEEININIKLDEINVGELGINTIEGILEYDEDIFEIVNTASFQGKNNWSFSYNEQATGEKGKFLAMILSTGVNEAQEIGTLTLKVRDSVKKSATSTNIVIKNIATNNGEELIKEEDKVIPVSLEVEYKEQNNIVSTVTIIIAVAAIIIGIVAILMRKK